MELNLVPLKDDTSTEQSLLQKTYQELTKPHTAISKTAVEETISIEKIKAIIIILTTQYTVTKKKTCAKAIFHNLCTLTDRYSNDPEQHFLNQSLAMEWYKIGRCSTQNTP